GLEPKRSPRPETRGGSGKPFIKRGAGRGGFDNRSSYSAKPVFDAGLHGRALVRESVNAMVEFAPGKIWLGSAANGILVDIIHQHGGNSYVSYLAATIMGSTETTFYVIAVYFGVVNIRFSRHAIPAGLIADFTGVVASVIVCHYLFGYMK
ncbi:MAG: hypothetical protein K2Q33_02655, partial [Gammaproteobacteria bacterium]|nr:hypothetical protein [Gammaproteobacteria bacterium]